MGHPERVIDPADGPLAAFAVDLVALRKTTAGAVTLRQLEARSGYSKAALSQACSGRALPTLELTLAYVGACGADMAAWETRWRALAALVKTPEPGRAPAACDGDAARVPGLSLREAVAAYGPLPEPCLRVLAARLAEILSDPHRAGIARCDLSPDSVLLAADGPRLVCAQAAAPAAPDQAGGDRRGPAEDAFALGALLLFAATGAPHGAGGPKGLFTRVVHREAGLGNLDRLSPQLRELIRACLNKDPAARPGTERIIEVCAAGEQPGPWLPPELRALTGQRTAADDAAGSAAPTSRGRRVSRRRRAVPVLAAAAVLVALLLAALTGGQPGTVRHGAAPGPTAGSTRDAGTSPATASGAAPGGSPAHTGQPGAAVPRPAAGSTPLSTSPSSGPAANTGSTLGGPALPAAPQNLNESVYYHPMPAGHPTTTITITWQELAPDPGSFEILIGGNTYSVSGTASSYSWTAFYRAYGICAQVRAVNAAGDSAWASVGCASSSGG